MAGEAVYLGSNVFIYAVEGIDETAGPAKDLLHFVRTRRPEGFFTSEITLAEVLAPTSRPDALPLQRKRQVYLDLLAWSGVVNLVQVTRSILIETADLRAVTKLKLPDAIHLVSAVRSRCRFFVSGDHDFAHLPSGMERVVPDERGVGRLLEVIA